MSSPDSAIEILSDEDEDDKGKTVETAISLLSDDEDGDETFSCPICWEDFDQQIKIVLLPTSCQHRACRNCLQKWWSTEEATGQRLPICPFDGCTCSIPDPKFQEDVLGGPFTPAGSLQKKRKAEQEQLSPAWLKKHNVILCGGCDTYITKQAGCNKVQCVCGFRICWKCKAVGGKCKCTASYHTYYDNLKRKPTESRKKQISKDKLTKHIKKNI